MFALLSFSTAEDANCQANYNQALFAIIYNISVFLFKSEDLADPPNKNSTTQKC